MLLLTLDNIFPGEYSGRVTYDANKQLLAKA